MDFKLFSSKDKALLAAVAVVVLAFVGIKMLVAHFLKIPVVISLGVICSVLAISIGLSLQAEKRDRHRVLPRTP